MCIYCIVVHNSTVIGSVIFQERCDVATVCVLYYSYVAPVVLVVDFPGFSSFAFGAQTSITDIFLSNLLRGPILNAASERLQVGGEVE